MANERQRLRQDPQAEGDGHGRLHVAAWPGRRPDTLLGKPVVIDPNMPDPALNALPIAFGDFSAFYIRDVQGVRFERSDDYAFANDLVTFRSLLRSDSNLIDLTGAIKLYKSGTAEARSRGRQSHRVAVHSSRRADPRPTSRLLLSPALTRPAPPGNASLPASSGG